MTAIQFFDEVINDIAEAKIWYKEQKDGLEIEFSKEVESTLAIILKMPSRYAVRYRNIRIAHVKIFPYSIHFYLNESADLIVITAIVHNKQHPNISKKRN